MARVPTQTYYAPPPWAEPSPAPEPVIYPSWSAEAEQGKADEESDRQRGAGYSLYCGFEEWDFSSSYDEPFELSPFPLPFSSSSSRSSRSSLYSKKTRRRSFHKSTGCGALIHTNGRPERGMGRGTPKGKRRSSSSRSIRCTSSMGACRSSLRADADGTAWAARSGEFL